MNLIFLKHIRSVAQYESKILMRSWFFRIFSILVICIAIIYNFSILLNGDGQPWIYKSIPANIPYLNMVLYNTAQAIIAVFLSSEFLKRDKQLDTSEVFYVHPLSNAEYVFGKIWGNMRVFLLLNIIVLAIAMFMNFMSPEIGVDVSAYFIYFFLISIPTLIFIIGLSIFLMLVIKNQALTFVLILGYIGLTLFYIQDKYYYLFDYMSYYLPLFKSTMIGLDNLDVIINHRIIYLCAGLACIFFTILLFHRQPNNHQSRKYWLLSGIAMLLVSGYAGYHHVRAFTNQEAKKEIYTALNNQYVHSPKMAIDRYEIDITQHPDRISSEVKMTGKALQEAKDFIFCLNPGLKVLSVRQNDKDLSFERDHQIIIVHTGQLVKTGENLTLDIHYEGKVDEDFCFLDIDSKVRNSAYEQENLKLNKRYCIQTSDYLLFTPECYWYPRPGTAYSNQYPDWLQTYFSNFRINVHTLPGLTGITQSDDIPLQAASLIIGKYKNINTEKNGVKYNLWYHEKNDFFTKYFDIIKDTVPGMLDDMKDNLEREYRLDYPFKQFSVVEVPAQFYSYIHSWSKAQEVMQPEMVLLPERGCTIYQCDFNREANKQKRFSHRRGVELSDYDARISALYSFFWMLLDQQDGRIYEQVRGNTIIGHKINPYFIFPQVFNFRYNFYSTEYPITNRIIEIYIQNMTEGPDWVRATNGIGYFEKANLLMKEKGMNDLLNDSRSYRSLEFIFCLRASDLFGPAEAKLGINSFKDSLYTVLKRNSFKNIRFETLLDTLENSCGVELTDRMKGWNEPTKLPYYNIQTPHVTQIKSKGKEYYVLEQTISNNSDYDGFVQMDLDDKKDPWMDKRTHQKIEIKAHQTKKLVSIWDEYIRWVSINTLLSENLPNIIGQSTIDNGKSRTSFYTKDSCYVLSNNQLNPENDIIVDNEDSLLFSHSNSRIVGLLPKWLDKYIDDKVYDCKYKAATHWNPPLEWTLITGNDFYGDYIHSAYVIKSGDGDQSATWKIPVPEPGDYDVYFHVTKGGEYRHANDRKITYDFTIKYDGYNEENYINMNRAENGWEKIGSYHFEKDTVEITLFNKCQVSWVVADAIKISKE